MNTRILIAEHDHELQEAVGRALRRECFDTESVWDGEAALTKAVREPYDLVLLGLDLPRRPGTDVIRRLRAVSTVPIIVLSGRDSELDLVLTLELGADDYLTKPVSMPVLLSRVRALLRRCELERMSHNGVHLHVGGVEIDLALGRVIVDERAVYLTSSQFKLLSLLAEEPGRVVTRREIVHRLWDSDRVADDHVCDVHVSNLRHKIERDPTQPRRIVTVRGAGYKLVGA
jgi:two-component system response regulator RegX3